MPRLLSEYLPGTSALYHHRLFLGAIDGRLIALDAATGKEVWSEMTVPKNEAYSVTMAPRVYKGKVVIGNSRRRIRSR